MPGRYPVEVRKQVVELARSGTRSSLTSQLADLLTLLGGDDVASLAAVGFGLPDALAQRLAMDPPESSAT